MGTLLSKIYNVEKRHFTFIILLQIIVIFGLLSYIVARNNFQTVLSAESNTFSEGITTDVKSCLSLSESERPVCAKIIGVKIADQFSNPRDRLKECLKFRPYSYTLQCEEGLAE